MPRESEKSRQLCLSCMHLTFKSLRFPLHGCGFCDSLIRLYKDLTYLECLHPLVFPILLEMSSSIVDLGVARIETTVTIGTSEINRLVKTFLSNNNCNSKKIIGLGTEQAQKSSNKKKNSIAPALRWPLLPNSSAFLSWSCSSSLALQFSQPP